MFTLLPLIIRNVVRNRRRSLLTLASTAVSLALLGFLVALYQGFFLRDDLSPSEALRLITRHKVSLVNPLPASHLERIRAIDGVEALSPWTWYQGVWKDKQSFFSRFAVDPKVIFTIRPDYVLPPDQLEAFQKQPTATVVARAIAEKYGMKIGDRINIKGDIYPVDLELTLVGIFDHPPNGQTLLFHQAYLRELLSAAGNTARRDLVGTFAIRARSEQDVDRVVKAIDEAFANSPFPTKTQTEKEFTRSFLAFIGNVKLFLVAVCGAVTFTILLVCANTVSMAVRERTREIAILRTLGYSPGEILQIVLGESVTLTVAGGVVGIGLAFLLGLAASKAGGPFPLPSFSIEAAVITLAMAVLIGVASSLLPAFLASRKNIVESLRFTG